jgi:hypothetical protein
MSTIKLATPTKIDTTAGWDNAVAAAGFNALANGGGFVGSEIDNSTTKFRFARLSFQMVTSTVTPTDGAHLAILVLPILDDGATYPDNEDTSTAANLPALAYQRGAISFRTKATQSIKGGCEDVLLPPSKFKFYVINRNMNGASALPSSSTNMTLKVQFYNEEIV